MILRVAGISRGPESLRLKIDVHEQCPIRIVHPCKRRETGRVPNISPLRHKREAKAICTNPCLRTAAATPDATAAASR